MFCKTRTAFLGRLPTRAEMRSISTRARLPARAESEAFDQGRLPTRAEMHSISTRARLPAWAESEAFDQGVIASRKATPFCGGRKR